MIYSDKNGNQIDKRELYHECPKCKHSTIDYTNNEFSYDCASQDAKCEGCGHEWVDNYVATGSDD